MKMKNYLKVLSSVMLLAFLGSCSGEEGKESVSGQGSIMVDLSTNLSYSRAVDESAYRNVNNYKVSLYKRRRTCLYRSALWRFGCRTES